LRGKFKDKLAKPLMKRLLASFEAEFPYSLTLSGFLEERGYMNLTVPEMWMI